MNAKTGWALFALSVVSVLGAMYMIHPKVKSLAELQANTVSLTMADGASCSGWVFKGQKAVITAAHCVSRYPSDPVKIDFHDGTGNHTFYPTRIGTPSGTLPDLAILTSTDQRIHWPVGLPLCNFKPYYLESVLMFGDPLGFTKSITQGSIANPSQAIPAVRDIPYIQYDGALSPGSSGSPVLDIKYQCVIASADALFPDQEGGSAVNFLEDSSRLGELK